MPDTIPLAKCAECGVFFPVPAVARCPECGSRQIRSGGDPSDLVFRLRKEARNWHSLPLGALLREAANELRGAHQGITKAMQEARRG